VFTLKDFFYPVSLIIENVDTLAVTGHINDMKSIVVRITGISTMLEYLIHFHRDNKDSMMPIDASSAGIVWQTADMLTHNLR
jgi:hypothetical protein